MSTSGDGSEVQPHRLPDMDFDWHRTERWGLVIHDDRCEPWIVEPTSREVELIRAVERRESTIGSQRRDILRLKSLLEGRS